MKERPQPARTSLAKIRDQEPNSPFVEAEYQELQRSYTVETMGGKHGGWLDCFRGTNLRRTFIGTCIQMMQQLSKFPELSIYLICH